MEIENKLKAMGLELLSVTPPPPGRAVAVKVGNILFVGGHTPGQEYRESWGQISLWSGPTMERGRRVSTVLPM